MTRTFAVRSIRYESRFRYLAATAVARQWLLCIPPTVTTQSAPCATASAKRNSSFRTLFPLSCIPERSSRWWYPKAFCQHTARKIQRSRGIHPKARIRWEIGCLPWSRLQFLPADREDSTCELEWETGEKVDKMSTHREKERGSAGAAGRSPQEERQRGGGRCLHDRGCRLGMERGLVGKPKQEARSFSSPGTPRCRASRLPGRVLPPRRKTWRRRPSYDDFPGGGAAARPRRRWARWLDRRSRSSPLGAARRSKRTFRPLLHADPSLEEEEEERRRKQGLLTGRKGPELAHWPEKDPIRYPNRRLNNDGSRLAAAGDHNGHIRPMAAARWLSVRDLRNPLRRIIVQVSTPFWVLRRRRFLSALICLVIFFSDPLFRVAQQQYSARSSTATGRGFFLLLAPSSPSRNTLQHTESIRSFRKM